MPQIKVLVGERLAVDRDASRPVPLEDVAALDHELLDDAVEGRFEISSGLTSTCEFAGAHPSKVFCGFRRFVGKQLHFYSSAGNSTNGNVEKYHRIAPRDGVQDDRVRHRDGHGCDASRRRRRFLRRSDGVWPASSFVTRFSETGARGELLARRQAAARARQ